MASCLLVFAFDARFKIFNGEGHLILSREEYFVSLLLEVPELLL